jgi:hypothetical protein
MTTLEQRSAALSRAYTMLRDSELRKSDLWLRHRTAAWSERLCPFCSSDLIADKSGASCPGCRVHWTPTKDGGLLAELRRTPSGRITRVDEAT